MYCLLLEEHLKGNKKFLFVFCYFYVYFLCCAFNLYFLIMFKNASAASGESSYLTITEPVSYIVIDPIPLDTEFECKFFYCFLFFIMT